MDTILYFAQRMLTLDQSWLITSFITFLTRPIRNLALDIVGDNFIFEELLQLLPNQSIFQIWFISLITLVPVLLILRFIKNFIPAA